MPCRIATTTPQTSIVASDRRRQWARSSPAPRAGAGRPTPHARLELVAFGGRPIVSNRPEGERWR